MGKFDNKLLLSDYDNTLHFTEAALREGESLPPISPRNLEAIRYWMDQGGRFAVATGRALAAFRRQAESIPMNAPPSWTTARLSMISRGGNIWSGAFCRRAFWTIWRR